MTFKGIRIPKKVEKWALVKPKSHFFNFLLLSVFYAISLYSFCAVDPIDIETSNSLFVDLRDPIYENGVLSTHSGGVITGPSIRIQARDLRYTRQNVSLENEQWTLEAEGDLLVQLNAYIFVGKKLYYNFFLKEGLILEGRTAVPPWFFGGQQLELKSDGSILIKHGYVTTSENESFDCGITSELVEIEKRQAIKANKVHLKIADTTVFYLPSLKSNINSILDNPIRYRFRWGGSQGPRLGLTYEVFSWEHWKTFLRFDYRFTRGPGGGIETQYRSKDKKTEFQSVNYLAKDSSILHPTEKARYRFEGAFRKLIDQDKTSFLLTYDKISDKDLPSTYYDRDFDFDTAERTQFQIKRDEDWGITSLYSRVRINSFQTVKEELPTLETNLKPFTIKNSSILFENKFSASYLQFKYSKYLFHFHNYESTRFEYFPTLYRPFQLGHFATFTPEVGMVTLFYGTAQTRCPALIACGKGGFHLQTSLFRNYPSFKHTIIPYIDYQYYSSPTLSSHDHYIFDISDGWTQLNMLNFGLKNSLYGVDHNLSPMRLGACDIYSFAFFDTEKIEQVIPRIYGKLDFLSCPTLRHTFDAGWNIEHQQIDFFNFKTEWTLSEDLALAGEYRHRGPYWWRKVDRENFFLDMFHSEERLRHSQLSEHAETLLLHCFYRFHPNWSCEITTRQGWDRKHSPPFCEYEIDLFTTIQSAWHLRLSYQHKENDDRVAIYLNVGLSPT